MNPEKPWKSVNKGLFCQSDMWMRVRGGKRAFDFSLEKSLRKRKWRDERRMIGTYEAFSNY